MSPRVEDLKERLEELQEKATEARVEVARARKLRDGSVHAAKTRLNNLERTIKGIERLLWHERNVPRGAS